MRFKAWAPRLLVALCVLQLGVPGFMIARREHVLNTGRAFKFKTEPVDPYDAYRGRYVALGFEAASAKGVSAPPDLTQGERVYALLGEDDKGFAKVVALSREKPAGGAYLKARVDYPLRDEVRLRFPFDRYYMEEGKAPRAEWAYRQHSRRGVADASAVVRVLGSQAVLQALLVDGVPIEDFLARPQTTP
jgi:uncharacterized membrane-anchored protein